jgi:hypothetical protein
MTSAKVRNARAQDPAYKPTAPARLTLKWQCTDEVVQQQVQQPHRPAPAPDDHHSLLTCVNDHH